MSAENPADTVIEQERIEAVLNHLWEQGGLYYAKNEPPEPEPSRARNQAVEEAMKKLADPAGRDWQMCDQDACEYTTMFKARAERAEAEVARLRATVDRVRALADAWKDLQFHQPKTDFSRGVKAQIDECLAELAAALDGGEQP